MQSLKFFIRPRGGWESFTDRELAIKGRERQVVLTLPKFSSVVQTVSRTDYISTVPKAFAEHAASYTKIAIIPPSIDIGPHRMIMVWGKRSNNNPMHRWIRDQIASLVKKYDADRKQ